MATALVDRQPTLHAALQACAFPLRGGGRSTRADFSCFRRSLPRTTGPRPSWPTGAIDCSPSSRAPFLSLMPNRAARRRSSATNRRLRASQYGLTAFRRNRTCACSGQLDCAPGCSEMNPCHTGLACNATTHRCEVVACAADAECPSTFRCGRSLSCVRKTCSGDAECGSGFCVNGLCFDGKGRCDANMR